MGRRPGECGTRRAGTPIQVCLYLLIESQMRRGFRRPGSHFQTPNTPMARSSFFRTAPPLPHPNNFQGCGSVSVLQEIVWPESLRTKVEEFVKNGGGLVTLHGAETAFPDCDAFNQMIVLSGFRGATETAWPVCFV